MNRAKRTGSLNGAGIHVTLLQPSDCFFFSPLYVSLVGNAKSNVPPPFCHLIGRKSTYVYENWRLISRLVRSNVNNMNSPVHTAEEERKRRKMREKMKN